MSSKLACSYLVVEGVWVDEDTVFPDIYNMRSGHGRNGEEVPEEEAMKD